MSQKPSVASGVLMYNDEGKIFLAQSPKWENKWIVPGGHLEFGETFEQNVIRECKEETNLDIKDVELIYTQESIFPKNFTREKKHFVFLDFVAKVENPDEVILNDEFSDEHGWFEPEEALEKLDLNDSTRIFIQKFIEYRNE